MSIPVVIASNGLGVPVKPVEKNAPTMIVATNGMGMPVVISDLGQPFIVNGLFDPSMLFSDGEEGVWFDPSDLSTLYQDDAGTQPVTAPGQSVGLMLDKSGNLRHATQPVAAKRPTNGIVPATGRRNLLTWTEEFDNAAWIKIGGAVSGQKLTEGEGDGTHGIRNPASAGTVAGVYTTYFDVKAAERTLCEIWVLSVGMGAGAGARFNLATGEVVSNRAVSSSSYIASSIEPLGDGVFRCSVTVNYSGAIPNGCLFPIADGTATNTLSYQGDGTSGIFVYKSQLELGSTPTPYQRVGSQYDVTEAGVPSLGYLSFDGVDDYLYTAVITPGTDKAQIFAGVRRLSSNMTQEIIGLGVGGLNGVLLRNSEGGSSFVLRSRGDGSYGVGSFASPDPATVVLTGISDISADQADLYVDRQIGSGVSPDQGAGLYAPASVGIGARPNGVIPFDGHIHIAIMRFGAPLSNETIAAAEEHVAGKTGVTL